jgi:dihydroorotate dehydrogenase
LFDEDAQRPIFFKLSPDLNDSELREIVSVTREKNCKVHGFIISNSTHEHDNLKSKYAREEGALSGVPLREKSTKMIEDVYKLTKGDTVIIGCGGIKSGKDAYEKILAGASAIQIYTSFIYHGPPVVEKIKSELSELLIKNRYASVSEAVGKGVMIEGRKRRFKWIPFL